MATKPSNYNLNVFKKPLALFSQSPMTGFYRDGYCRVGAEDGGNHAVAARWKEAMEARKADDDPVVPKVFLHATDESALSNGVTMDILKKFAADGEAQGGGASLEKKTPITPGVTGGIAKETH